MKVTVYEKSIFSCGIDRAFKAPILGDATRFLNGYLCQPPIIGFENDENWGLLDGIRYPIIQGNFFIKAHRIFKDKIIEKNDDRFWKWELTNFTSPYLFFAYRAIGSWSVQKLSQRKISILYSARSQYLRVQELKGENASLKELVADLSLEVRDLKKNIGLPE